MTSPLAGSLARTIGKALAPVFLPATLTRGSTLYPCRGIYEQWGKASGAGGVITNPDVKALLLANSLAVEPNAGDVVSLQGTTFVVVSNIDTKPAVSTDPARATWSLLGKFVAGAGLPVDVNDAYAQTAQALGLPYQVFRSSASNPFQTTPIETTPVVVTSAKSSGFDYKRSSTYDDVLFSLQADFTNIQIGDYLVGPAGTLFIADMPSLRPVVAVLCNTTVSVTRPSEQLSSTGGQAPGLPSQPGNTGSYWGSSTKPTTDPSGPGEVAIKSGIPASMIGTTGRATGLGELPSDAPGPSRWRVYVPQSAFPKGAIKDRDILTDDQGERLQVSADYFSTIGYRLECVRLEN
jgi:hypothetical protein